MTGTLTADGFAYTTADNMRTATAQRRDMKGSAVYSWAVLFAITHPRDFKESTVCVAIAMAVARAFGKIRNNWLFLANVVRAADGRSGTSGVPDAARIQHIRFDYRHRS